MKLDATSLKLAMIEVAQAEKETNETGSDEPMAKLDRMLFQDEKVLGDFWFDTYMEQMLKKHQQNAGDEQFPDSVFRMFAMMSHEFREIVTWSCRASVVTMRAVQIAMEADMHARFQQASAEVINQPDDYDLLTTIKAEDITEDDLDAIAFTIGAGEDAWDMVDGRELVAAAVRIVSKRRLDEAIAAQEAAAALSNSLEKKGQPADNTPS